MAKKITICPNPKCRRVITNASIKSCPHCGTTISPKSTIGLSEEPIEDNNRGSNTSYNQKKKSKKIPEQQMVEEYYDDDYLDENLSNEDSNGYEAEEDDDYLDDDDYEVEDSDGYEGEEDDDYSDDDDYEVEDSDGYEGEEDDDYSNDDDYEVEDSDNYEGEEDTEFMGEDPDEQIIDKNSIEAQYTKSKAGKNNNLGIDTSQKHEELLSTKDFTPQEGRNNIGKIHTSVPYAIDPLTGLIVREDLKKLLASTDIKTMSVVSVKINYLEDTYKSLGKTCGNRLLTAVASNLQSLFSNRCCRFTKDRIIVILDNIEEQNLKKRLRNLTRVLNSLSSSDTDGILYDVSIGIASGDGVLTKQEILKMAGNRMMEIYSQTRDKEISSQSSYAQQEEFNPNYDHYYDEVLPEILEEVDRIPMQSILKVVFSLVFLLAVIAYLILFL